MIKKARRDVAAAEAFRVGVLNKFRRRCFFKTSHRQKLAIMSFASVVFILDVNK